MTMKKLLASVLALLLVASFSITAFAETNNGTKNTSTEVKGIYEESSGAPDTVALDITWDEMKFSFTEGKKTWDPATHELKQEAGVWSDEAKTVTLVNHSNVELDVGFSFRGDGNVTGAFTENALTMKSGRGVNDYYADKKTTSFKITGGSITKSGDMGSIVVSVSIPAATVVSTPEELFAAVADSSVTRIRLAGDIEILESIVIENRTLIIDFNDNVLNSYGADTIVAGEGAKLTVKNGWLHATDNQNGGGYALNAGRGCEVTMEDCDINSDNHIAVNIDSASVTLKKCHIFINDWKGVADANVQITGTGTLTLSGRFAFDTGFVPELLKKDDTAKVICLEGNYAGFNPTEYVDSDLYTVTEDADNSFWTVTAK